MSIANARTETKTDKGCEDLLDKCVVVVEKQRIAIKEQGDQIEKQKELVEHLEKVSEVQEKEIKDTRSWLYGTNVLFLLLMLL